MANVNKETQSKIEKLQLLEQKTQTLLMQKQNFQTQLLEVENALAELGDSKGPVYKIIGNIMILSDNVKIKEDLINKKDVFDLRIKNIEKQENKLKEEAVQIQSEVIANLKKED